MLSTQCFTIFIFCFAGPIAYDNTGIIPKTGLSDKLVYLNLTSLFKPGNGCPPLTYRILISPMESPLHDKRYRTDIRVKYEDLERQVTVLLCTEDLAVIRLCTT